MSTRGISRRGGFTLIELTLYVAIASVVLLAITAFLFTLLDARIKGEAVNEVNEQGATVMDRITQTIRNADSLNGLLPGASAASLSLGMYTSGVSPTVFDLSNGAIRITEGSNGAIALTDTHAIASGLSFTDLERSGTPGSVEVSFTLTYTSGSGRAAYQYTRTFTSGASLRQP